MGFRNQELATIFLLTIATLHSAYCAEKAVGVTKAPIKRTGAVNVNINALESISGAKMLAATSDKQNAVYVKWVLDDRWLPAQGFNLYRKGSGDAEFKKIAGPLKETSLGKINLHGLDGAVKQVDIGLLQQAAKKTVVIPVEMSRIFKVNPIKVESAKPVFNELKLLKQQQFAPFTGTTRPTFDRFEPTSFTKLTAYYQHFNAAGAMIPRGAIKAKGVMAPVDRSTNKARLKTGVSSKGKTQVMSIKIASPVETVMDARRKLMLGTLVNPEVTSALGLGYIDTSVKAGETYEYKLREIDNNGTESNIPAASCTITVGADPKPVQPTGLDAVQRGVKTVDLRWDLDAQETPNTVISYDIFRISGGQRKKINGEPLMIGPVKDSEGAMVDMIYYYTDGDAPVGSLKYELIGADMFGRLSPPAVLAFNMADVETPNPPSKTTGSVNGSAVHLSWSPSIKLPPGTKPGTVVSLDKAEDKNAVYNIWRCDTESNPVVWTKLTSSPIPYMRTLVAVGGASPGGNFTDNSSQTDHRYRFQVTALYSKNMIESAPGAAADVAVPDVSQPKSPQNLTVEFTSLVPQAATALSFDNRTMRKATLLTKSPVRVRNLYKQPNQWKIQNSLAADKPVSGSSALAMNTHNLLTESYSHVAAATLLNSDMGGMVLLKWDAPKLTAPIRYKIWRADASGYTLIKESTSENAAPRASGAESRKSVSMIASEKRAIRSLTTTAAAKSRMLIKGGSQEKMQTLGTVGAKMEYFHIIPIESMIESMWTLVGETDKPTFRDFIPRSRPAYYNYRVTISNRWGVESPVTATGIRIPATIPPPTPEFSYAAPNMDGGVTLNWKALQNKEECAKYIVYRKKVEWVPLVIQPLNVIRFDVTDASTESDKQPSVSQSGGSSLALGVARSAVDKRESPVAPVRVRAKEVSKKIDVTISPATMEKAEKRGLRSRVSLSSLSPEARQKISIELSKPEEYQVVGEAEPDKIDSKGNVVYVDTNNLIPNELYSYTIIAQDADKWRSDASQPLIVSPFRTKADPPAGLKAALHASGRGVVLNWNAPQKAEHEEIIGYFVQRSNAGNNTFIQISNLGVETSWTDRSVMKGRSYSYRVLSMDKQGNLSDPVQLDFAVSK